MFLLKLYDRERNEVKIGDIVQISDGKFLKFYCRVTFLEQEKKLAPFHTFSFHSILKVDAVPDTAQLLNEPRYECWYAGEGANPDTNAEAHQHYLMEWRKCERLLESVFDVVPYAEPEKLMTDDEILSVQKYAAFQPDFDAKFNHAVAIARKSKALTRRKVFVNRHFNICMMCVVGESLWLYEYNSKQEFLPDRNLDRQSGIYFIPDIRIEEIPDSPVTTGK